MSYFIIIYDEFQLQHDEFKRQLALETERKIQEEGDYRVHYADGDGFLTYVMFESSAEMAVFRMRYMKYSLPPNIWMISCGHLPNTQIEGKLDPEWWTDIEWGCLEPLFSMFAHTPSLQLVMIPHYIAETMIQPRYWDLIVRYEGTVTMKPIGDTRSSFLLSMYMTEANYAQFLLNL